MRRHSDNFYKKFTKEYLKSEYKKYGTLKAVAIANDVTQGFIRKRMNKLHIPYRKKIKYTCDEGFFNYDNEHSFYWAGFIAADGNVSKQNDISLSLAEKDKAHLYKFKKDLKTDSPIKLVSIAGKRYILNREVNISNQYKIRFRSEKTAKHLEKFNIYPNKTKTYSLPFEIKKDKNFRHFIRGYFDGDGWYSLYKKRLIWGLSGNKWVLEDIKLHLNQNLNMKSGTLYKRKNNFYILTYSKQREVFNISKYLYANSLIFLDRKYFLSKISEECDNNTVILNINKEKLLNLYNKTQSVHKVAKQLNCCSSSVFNYMKKYNIKLTSLNKGERISAAKRLNLSKDILIKLYNKHKTIKGVAIEMSRSPTTIKKYLMEYKIL